MHQFNEYPSKPQLFVNKMNSEVTIESQLRADLAATGVLVTDTNSTEL